MQNIRCLTLKIGTNSAFCKFMLVIAWGIGLLAGIYIAYNAPATTLSMMRMCYFPRVSIIGFVLILTFPLILSVIAIRLHIPFMCYFIALLKAFCFSYSTGCIIILYGSAGWLVRWLLIFSDSCTVVVLFWFWFRYVSGDREVGKRDVVICILLTILICCADYYIVSPFVEILLCH